MRDNFDRFEFAVIVERRHKDCLLYLVTEKLAHFGLHPNRVSNTQMGLVFEELIRRFAEISNETAGERLTPGKDTALERRRAVWGAGKLHWQ